MIQYFIQTCRQEHLVGDRFNFWWFSSKIIGCLKTCLSNNFWIDGGFLGTPSHQFITIVVSIPQVMVKNWTKEQEAVSQSGNPRGNCKRPGRQKCCLKKISWLPSGKHTKNYGKSLFLIGKSTTKGPFSIAMLNY